MLAGANLGGDDVLVASDLVRIDLAVVVDVQNCKEPLGVLLHLLNGQSPVMVLVGLLEPVSQRVIVAADRSEGFSHGADEQPSRMAGPRYCGCCRTG